MLYKRIVLVSHEMTYTGSPRSLYNMASVLKNNGLYVELLTLKDGPFRAEFEKLGIKTTIIDKPIKCYHDLIVSFDLAILNTIFTLNLLDDFQPYLRTVLFIREGKNISSIISNCALDENALLKAKEIWTVSEYSKKTICELCHPSKIIVLHNFVDDIHKRSFNFVRNETIHYLISGTIEYRKGIDLVIDAFLRMPDFLKKKSYLHIVGDKPDWARNYWESLEQICDDHILYHGLITDDSKLYDLYKSMNVFVIPSRDEACSLVALEGAMLGKAIIFSESVGAQYLDSGGFSIVKSDDVEALSRKMCEFTSRRILLIQGMKMKCGYYKTSTRKRYTVKLMKLLSE